MYGEIDIYTVNRAPEKTIIWRGYSFEAMRHITGKQERPITCYVEDDVAEHIVGRVASEAGVRRFLSIGKYGPAGNAFPLGAGLCLSLLSTDNTLVMLDGDVFATRLERRKNVRSAMSGDQPIHSQQRRSLMRLVRSFASEKNGVGTLLSPEQVLHRMLRSLDIEPVPHDRREILVIAAGIINVPEKHGFVAQIIEHIGEPRGEVLSKIVELASKSVLWPRYTRVFRTWLKARKAALGL